MTDRVRARALAMKRWEQLVGRRKNETQWFYEQAKANECSRIILSECIAELEAEIRALKSKGKK